MFLSLPLTTRFPGCTLQYAPTTVVLSMCPEAPVRLAVPVLLRAGPVRLAHLSLRSSTLLHTTLEPGAPRPHQGAHGSASLLTASGQMAGAGGRVLLHLVGTFPTAHASPHRKESPSPECPGLQGEKPQSRT